MNWSENQTDYPHRCNFCIPCN